MIDIHARWLPHDERLKVARTADPESRESRVRADPHDDPPQEHQHGLSRTGPHGQDEHDRPIQAAAASCAASYAETHRDAIVA